MTPCNSSLRNQQKSPKVIVPIAMMFVTVGMMVLVIGVVVLPRLSPPALHAGTDWNEFLRGVMIGFAIVLEAVGLVIAAKAAAATRAKKL